MKIAPNFKPHLCASKDSSRYILQHVCVRHGMSIATNGKIMVAGINDDPEEKSDPENILLPLPACVAATKKRNKNLSILQNVIEVKEHVVKVCHNLEQTTSYKRPDLKDENFPNILRVLPDIKKPTTITFNVALLKQITDSIGEDSICLTFDLEETKNCMIVTSIKNKDRFGLLMPTRDHGRDCFELLENLAFEKLCQTAKKESDLAKEQTTSVKP